MSVRTIGLWAMVAVGCGSAGDPDAGEVVYGAECAQCHGANGTGEAETEYPNASDLTVVVPELSDAEIVDVMLEGTGTMPRVSITDVEADDVVAYLRQEF